MVVFAGICYMSKARVRRVGVQVRYSGYCRGFMEGGDVVIVVDLLINGVVCLWRDLKLGLVDPDEGCHVTSLGKSCLRKKVLLDDSHRVKYMDCTLC